MRSLILPFERLRRQLHELARDRRGIAAVEFAMLLPLMVTLYLGGVEISQAVGIDRKVSLTARVVADLVAQQGASMTSTQIANILNAGKAVTAPYSATYLEVTVSSVKFDVNKKATIAWSRATAGVTPRPTDQDVSTVVPEGLKTPDKTVIWAEVKYTYTPTVGYIITGPIPLTDQIYMRPRLQDTITCCT